MKVLIALVSILLMLTSEAAAVAVAGEQAGGASADTVLSVEVRDAEISDVLRALAQQSGLNIILGEGVSGKISLSFKDIPFKNALEMIIRANGLAYTVQNNVFWVGKKVDKTGEFTMETVRLNYADPSSVVAQLKGVISPDGLAFADSRTNSIIIRDLPKNIEKAHQILKAVDIQAAQVVIEGRIIEATSNFTRQLGIQWGGLYSSGRDSATGSQLLGTSSAGRNFAVNLPATSPTSGVAITLGNISNKLLLDLELTAAESRGDLRIISRPRISTLNNKPATIHSGLTFRVKLSAATTTGTSSTATTTTTTAGTLEEIKTGIDLTVTPQIASDGYVLLSISTNKSDPDYTHTVDGIPGVTEKSATTNILVKDGDTVVIGGLYKSINSDENDKVPFFGDIPVVGALFRSSSKSVQNEELLVFITPRIVKSDHTTEVVN